MKPKRTNMLTASLRAAKTKSRRFGATQMLIGTALISLVGQQAKAQDLFWDNGATPTGTWDAAGLDWDADPNLASAVNVAWAPGSEANFNQLVGGTVSLIGTQNVSGVAASSPGTAAWILADGGAGSLQVTGSGTISAGLNDTLAINVGIDGAAAGQALDLSTGGGTSALSISGNIGSNIGAVSSSGVLTLSGSNSFTGTLSVTGGATTLQGGNAVTDTSGLTLLNSATVVLANSEAVGNLTGDAGTTINSGANLLTANQSGNTTFAGTLNGTNGFTKNGIGILTLSGANGYSGLTTVNAGTLVAANDQALGVGNTLADRTDVANGATVRLGDTYTSAEFFNITGTGDATLANMALGALDTRGVVTLNGNTTDDSIGVVDSATISSSASGATAGLLTINGDIIGDNAGDLDILTFSVAAGSLIDVNDQIDGNVDGIIKTGQGTLDLRDSDADHTEAGANITTITDGVLIINGDTDLGDAGNTLFNGGALELPTLRIMDNDVTFDSAGFNRDLVVGGTMSQIDVDGSAGRDFNIDNNDLIFLSAANTIRKIGIGELNIDTNVGGVGVGDAAFINGILDPDTGTINVLGSGFSGVVPAFLPGGVPAPGTTSLTLAGLGDADGGQTGVINIGLAPTGEFGANNEFDFLVIDQAVDTTFDGTLNTTGDLLITGTGNLQLGGQVNVNNIHVSGTQLIVTDPTSLGDFINSHDQRATFVWGQFSDPLVPEALNTPGQLSLSGGITTNERITIVNNGILNNLDGDNIVDAEVRIDFEGGMVPPGFTGSDNAQIGSTIGTLTLAQGVFSNPGQNVTFNGLNTDAGTVNVAGAIQSTVADVVMGNTANNTNTVILGSANSYSGQTILNGGNVIVGNINAFSGSDVTVAASTNLDSNGTLQIGNDIDIAVNTTLTLGTSGNNIGLSGTVSGFGRITNAGGLNALAGNNTYTGTTAVTAGALTLAGTNDSVAFTVDAGTLNVLADTEATSIILTNAGTLTTTGADRLADAAVVSVDGTSTLNLGGKETIGSLTSSGTVTVAGLLTTTLNSVTVLSPGTLNSVGINTNSLTVTGTVNSTGDITTIVLSGAPATGVISFGANTLTAQSGVYTGNLVGVNGSLVKNGGGLLNITGDNSGLTGTTTVNNGTLAANNLGSTTVDINTGGTLTATGTFAATNINVDQGAVLQANAVIAAAANVNTSGIVNITSGPNTFNSLNFNAASGSVNVTGGDLAVNALTGAAGTLNLAANNFTAGSGNFGGSMIGSGTFTKASAGALTLSGNINGFTGPTTVALGTLDLQSAFGSSAITVDAGAFLNTSANEQLANTATLTANGTVGLGGAETIGTLAGTGIVNAAGNLTVTTLNGSAQINAGTNTVTAQNGTFGGSINGNGGLIKNSAGTLSLNAANAYTGTTQVNAGTLDVNAALSSQTLNVASGAVLTTSGGNLNNGASLTNNGLVTVEADETVTTYTSGGPGANNGLLNGAGRLTASTYNLNDGSDVTANLGTGIVNSNGTVSINNTTTNANAINVQSGTLTAAGTFAATNIGVNSGATLVSNGILAVNANMVVGGTANINGVTTVQTLSVTPASGIVNLGANLTTTNLNGSGLISLGANTLTASSGTFSGTINGGGGLTKNGAGMTLTLSGSNDYTGTTNVNAGTLAIESDLASLTLNIANGAFLTTNANELLSNNATVNTNNTGTLDLGGNETFAVLNGNGTVILGANTLTLNNGGNFTGNIGGTGEIILAGGTFTVGALGGLNADDLDINFGSTIVTTAANLIGNGTAVNNDGTLQIGGPDTVGSYTSTGTLNSTIAGDTLTASTYALNNGSIVNANTGLGVMTTNGVVNINSASTGAGVLTVQSGTLNAGNSVNDLFLASQVTVSANSTLNSNGTFTNLPTLQVSGIANLNTVTNLTGLGVNAPGLVEINGAALTTLNLSGDGTIDLNNNVFNVSQGAFEGTLLGSGTLNKNGAGLLTLSGTNSYTGPTNVNAGTLNAVTALNTSAVSVAAGATYLNTGGLIMPNVAISNNGTFTLFNDEQASVYNSVGGTLNGLGTLTAPTYNLSNGANTTQGANLGTGVLNSGPGIVTLLGNSAANDVNVLSGTLNVGGNLGSAGATIDISGGATLAMSLNGGLAVNGDMNDTAIVNNAGTLTLSDDDLVASYTSGGPNVGNGLLNGLGTLTAATYALNNNSVTVLGANLGDGTLTTNGNVLLGGTAGAETVTIQTGTLTLGSSERLDDTAVVTNRGRLDLNGTETIGTFISSGILGGAGTLIGTGNTITLQNGHVSLVGTTIQDFGPNPNLTSNGTVNINGANNQVAAQNARLNVNTAIIQSGTMNLTGLFINNGSLTIDNGAALVTAFSDRIADGATLINNGTWTLGGNDTVGSYTSTGTLNGAGITLTAATYDLNGGSVVNANIGTGIVTTNGNVALNGTSAANTVNINFGSNLTLGLANRLSDGATVTSAGTLTLNGNDTILTYVSNGATLAGNGTLTATTFDLNNNSVVNFGTTLGDINPGSSRLFTSGNVFLNGTSNVDRVTIEDGNLIGGANAALNYVNLEGNGALSLSGGTFTNTVGRTINPGIFDGDNTGALTINDNFVNQGNLVLDVDRASAVIVNCQLSANAHDTLVVNGVTTLGGSVNVTNLGGNLARGESATLIQGGGDITVNGAVFTHGFNTRNFLVINNNADTASLLGTGVAGVNGNLSTIGGLNLNQIAIANAVNNNIAGNGNILNTSVVADQVALFVVGDCESNPAAALNLLSPESYAGFVDYGIQVTKSYTSAAMNMPGFSADGTARSVSIPVNMDSTASDAAPSYREMTTSVFAGFSHFSTGSSSSFNGADFDITSNGGLVGVRHQMDCFTLSGFLGVDRGDIESATLDADVDGYLLGAVGTYMIKQDMNLMLIGGVTYGNYDYDGSRQTFGGPANFSGVNTDVFDVHLAIEGDAYSDDKIRVTPFLGVHYVTSETDSFNETGPLAALAVGAQDEDAFFTELGVKAEYQFNNQLSFNGNLSYTHNFSDSDRKVNANLGGTAFAVSSPGLGEDFFTIGVGAQFQVTEDVRLGVNYRAEISDDADNATGVTIGGSYSF